jgi:Na+/H+ antiporter NhaC
MRRLATRGRTFMAPDGARGVAMMDVLFWAFFGIGFLVMMAMIVFVFRSIGNGKKERDHWKALDDNSSILRR